MKAKNFIYSKYALVFAIIPGVNLAYLVLYFLSGNVSKEWVHHGAMIAILIVASLLYRLLPDMWGWAVTYCLLSGMSLLCLRQIRKNGNLFQEKNKKIMRNRMIVLLIATTLLIGVTWVSSSGSVIKDRTFEMLNAALTEDQTQWKALLNQTHEDTIDTVQIFLQNLEQQNITLSGTVERLTQTGISMQLKNEVKQTTATYRATIGGVQYIVRVTYMRNNESEGFSFISIEPD